MGAGSSLPSRDRLTEETIKTKNILNGILDFMLSESDLMDMYALASDKRCDDYTIFTAKSLDTFFKKIQLSPTVSEDGNFYFQDLYTLKKLSGRTGEKHTENCLKLSRFFIRILHIFASLSLTIMDVEVPRDNDTLNTIGKRVPSEMRRVTERNVRSIPYFRNRQLGGTITDFPGTELAKYYVGKDTPYEILNQYISFDRNQGYYYFDKYRSLYLYANSLKPSQSSSINPKFSYSYVKPVKNGNKASRPVEIEGYFMFEKLVNLPTLKISVAITSPSIYKSSSSDNFRYDGTHYTWNNKKIPDYIMFRIEEAIGDTRNTNNTRRVTKRSNLNRISKEITNPSFKVTGFLDAIKNPPKAYCVARALQLLSPESIFYSNRSSPARTQICDPNFSLLGKGSLPKSKEPITSSPSIMSLYLLFFDSLEKSVPKISEKVRPKYDEFTKTMGAIYEDETKIKSNTTDLERITNIPNAALCQGKQTPLYISDQDVIMRLRGSAAKLLSRQLDHTSRVLSVLKKLFIITPTKPILLHPSIEKGGMDAVEMIATEARELLIEYYSGCEVEYREAVQTLKEAYDENIDLFRVNN